MEQNNSDSVHVPLLGPQSTQKNCAYLKANFIDTYLLFWVGKIISIGNKKPFQQDMHWDLRKKETSEELVAFLSTKFELVKHKKNPLARALAQTSKGIFIRGVFCVFASGLLQYAGPFLMKYIIDYITEEDKDITTGVLLVLGIVLARVFASIFDARCEILTTLLGINTSIAVNGLVYKKALKFSLVRSVDHSLGSLTNHIQVDAEKLYYLGSALGGVLTLPFIIVVGVYFMYAAVGISFLAGIGVILVMAVINSFISRTFYRAQKIVMEKKDERMKISTEILNGIKYIKMSGWEEAFLQKVGKARDEELRYLRRQFINTCFSVFSVWLTPMLITIALFGVYILTGNEMNAKTAFTIVSTVTILQGPIRQFPSTLMLSLECKVALDRVTKFLLSEEVNLDYIKRDDISNSNTAIKVDNGNFYWLTEEEKKLKKKKEEENQEKKEAEKKKEEKKKSKKDKKNSKKGKIQDESNSDSIVISSQDPKMRVNPEDSSSVLDSESPVRPDELNKYKLTLQGVNLEIKKGSFVAILGEVGSGKSSFLLSLIGEMKYNSEDAPEVEVNGSMSYLPQQPWILNTTVKQNITFGRDFNEQKYQDAIKYSCLQSDLDILTRKDETEIGEKGVNLSGGQKARVSLARSLYRDSDIYLLDDPLSAVDAHVGNFILKECFMGHLKGRTRVLVTHKFECLKYVDYIYIFHRGRVVEEGTFESLKDSSILQEVEKKYKMQESKEGKQNEDEVEVEDLIEKEEETETKHSELENGESEISLSKDQGSQSPRSPKLPAKKKKEAQPETEDDKKLQQKLMLDEDREIGVVGWSIWKSYFTYYGGWLYFCLVFLVMLIWILLQTASNFWLSYWSNTADDPKYSRGFFFEIYAALGVGYAVFCFLRMILVALQSIRCSRMIHRDMFVKLIRAPVNLFFDRVPIGRLLNRLSKDLTVLDNYIATAFGSVLVLFFCLMSDIVVCIVVGTIWVIPLVFIFFIFCYKIQKSYMTVNREVVRLESISKSPIVSFLSQTLTGLTSIRAYQEEEKSFNKFHELQNSNIKNLILGGGLQNWFTLRVTFASVLIIAPSLGVPLLLSNSSLNAGLAGLLITYVTQVSDDIIWLIWAISNFESKLISLERCRAFTQIQGEAPAKTVHPETVENYSPNWPSQSSIKFKDYYVKYRPDLPHVVKDLSFSVNSGEKVGVVGRTGSGKSTLLLSLLRIIEADQGTIYIDDVDTSKIGLDDLRRKITIIPQDPMLFKGSLRENLDLFKKYTDEQLWESLDRVCLKTKFEQENGLNTEIKEGGENLSAGEKQLLCIGRAILAQSKIILIDEATSNIDPKTEETILNTIYTSFKECTVLTIAHRLKTVINSDKILVMGDGQLLEYDAPQKLIDDENTYFHKLWMEYEHAHRSHE